ncbi:MAG: peptidylprolyl isomerase [Candidatus Fermentibacteraceae bacterium]
MRMITIMAVAVTIAAIGCSRSQVHGNQWIIASPHDTVTVSDAAGIWASLDDQERAVFTGTDDPAGAFLDALSGKAAIERLAEESGLLEDPDLNATASCWLRVESAMAARLLDVEEETASVTDGDMQFWRENQGLMVWFSADTPCPEGPFAIAELPRELGATLRQIAPGESASLEGFGVVTLDSLLQTPRQSGSLPDSVVAVAIGKERERFKYLQEFARMIERGETGISPGFANLSLLPEDSIVVYSPLGQWTRSQIETELAFIQTRFPQVEASAHWAGMMLENLVMQSHYRNVLVSEHPEVADSLREASLAFLKSQAAEVLVRQYLDSAVTVTRADLEEEYSVLAEPPLSAELRVFHLASAGIGELPDLRRAMADGIGLDGFPGVPELASPDGDPRISRPLMNADIPSGTASVLFGVAETDTLTWFGPLEINQGYFAAFRLREVVPPRPATIEEIEPQLIESARRRLEAEAMEAFLDEIRLEFQIIVNDDVREKLSPDPGQWGAEV